MLIVDAHVDIAWNMVTFGRDYTRSAAETRQLEAGSDIPWINDDTLLGWPDYQRGRVALIFSTLFAAPLHEKKYELETQVYTNVEQANRLYRAQLDLYHRLADEHADKFQLVLAQSDLQNLLAHWEQEDPAGHPVGMVILMEGAEGVRAPGELEEWWERGVRIIGPAWAGTRFCGGTREPGPLTPEGFALLEGMASLGFSLDLSHMDEQAALQALDFYPHTPIITHANALALLKGSESNRHLSDRVIRGLLERGGIIGVVPFNAFLRAGWKRGDRRGEASLGHVVAQIDYICQMAGDALHVGLGSDFDGGFGLQSVPPEIDTVSDLQKLAPLLAEKGYTPADIASILGENWLAHLRNSLPESR
jgi:membrane dipeptidase